MPKKVVTGIVTRDKAAKTRRVEITRLVQHPRYGKILRRRTVCTAHDEENVSRAGDLVEIEESRPLSRTKRWKLLRVVVKGQAEAGESSAKGDAAAVSGISAVESQ
jgi:small subunit ribosomal protein S17